MRQVPTGKRGRLSATMCRWFFKPFLENFPWEKLRPGLEAYTYLPSFSHPFRTGPLQHPSLRGEWVYSPGNSSPKIILYFHGGGFLMGSPRTHRNVTITLAHYTGARVLCLDYRLAPENPYPAAFDDAREAYQALLAEGSNPADIAFAGDSAGGALALSTMLVAQARGLPLPAGAALFSPLTDLFFTGSSIAENSSRCALLSAAIAEMISSKFLQGRPVRELDSPLTAELAGMPPLLIHVGSTEVLLDDSLRLATRAGQAGVEVQLTVWEQLPHAWQTMYPTLPYSGASLREASKFLCRQLNSC